EAGSLLEAALRAAAGPACSRPSRKACLDAVEALASRAGLLKGRRTGWADRSDPEPASGKEEESDADVALDVLKRQLSGVLAVLQSCIAARTPLARADAEAHPPDAKAPGGAKGLGSKPTAAAEDAVVSSLVLAEALSALIASEAQARVLSSAVLALVSPRGVARASDSTLRSLSLLSRLWEGRGAGSSEGRGAGSSETLAPESETLAPESSALLSKTLATLAPLVQEAADPL
ncbi:hypothetical protein H632_c4613p0, partial [Helicosporidium sp. ATCC 50920]